MIMLQNKHKGAATVEDSHPPPPPSFDSGVSGVRAPVAGVTVTSIIHIENIGLVSLPKNLIIERWKIRLGCNYSLPS